MLIQTVLQPFMLSVAEPTCVLAWILLLPLSKPDIISLSLFRIPSFSFVVDVPGLLWEGDGFLLFTIRMEEGRFSWPRSSSEARSLSPQQFKWLMQGFSIDPIIKVVKPTRTA